MNIEQAKKAFEIIIKAGLVPCGWGPGGVGKTTMCEQIAEKHKVDFGYMTTNTSMLDHLTGTPKDDGNGGMIWTRPKNIPLHGNGIFLIDELSDGMLSIQKMFYSLILKRESNGHKLGDGWKTVVMANRPCDSIGSSMPPAPLITRMIHIGICCEVPDFTKHLTPSADVDVDSWIEAFALPNKVNPFIIAFLKSFPHRIYHFQAIPRTFEMLSKILSVYNNPDSILHEIITGTIGPEVGHEFFGFYKLAQQIPSIDSILNDPDNAPLPQNVGIMHALSTALVYRADRSNFANIIKYAKRIGHREIEVFLITSCTKKDTDLLSIPAYLQWHNNNADILN